MKRHLPDDVAELERQLCNLNLDDDEKYINFDVDDEGAAAHAAQKMLISRKDPAKHTLAAPNSITLDYKCGNDQHETILFGLQGSRVGIAISVISDENTGDYFYHFGLVLIGNDYTITDHKTGAQFKKQHYMVFHLLEDGILITVCSSKDDVEKELHSVWPDVKGEKLFKLKALGHSFLSVQMIAEFLNKERDHQKIPYTFASFQEYARKGTAEFKKKYTVDELKKITNCFMFVIRFTKLLNIATNNKSIVPRGTDIIKWFGRAAWKYPEEFEKMWNICLDVDN